MASVNKWIGIGNLGKDPEMRAMPNGDAVANITIACTESWKDKGSGEKKEATEWVRVVFFGKLAEIVGQYLKKGRQVYIEGAIKTRKWTDKEGQDRYSTEIVASDMKMLGSKPEDAGEATSRPAPAPRSAAPAPAGDFNDFEDDPSNHEQSIRIDRRVPSSRYPTGRA